MILGSPFLTQLYASYVHESVVHTKILRKQIPFEFYALAKVKEIPLLRNSLIFKTIIVIIRISYKVIFLKDEISYKRIKEQLQNPTMRK